MNEVGVTCRVRVIKYHSYKGEVGKINPNLLERDFNATKPREKMATDVTQMNIFGTKLYFSPLIDLYNGEVIGYDISKSPNMMQIKNMLDMAFKDIKDCNGAILHTDQGWQYQQKKYQNYLKEKNIRGSMSRKGNCLDNAKAESFFAIFKTELIYAEDFRSVKDCINKIHEYIKYYNNERIKESLEYLTPVKYRNKYEKCA